MNGRNVGDVKVLKAFARENTDIKFHIAAMADSQNMIIVFSSWVPTKKIGRTKKGRVANEPPIFYYWEYLNHYYDAHYAVNNNENNYQICLMSEEALAGKDWNITKFGFLFAVLGINDFVSYN